MSTNILINSRSMNGIITISDGSATLENGDLNCDDINSSSLITTTLSTGIFTCRGEFRSNTIGPYTIPTLVSSEYGSLISYGNTTGNGATDFTNYQSTYTSTKGGFNFWNKSSTQTLINLAIIDNSQTYFKSQLIGCTAESPLNTTSIVNRTYVDNNFVDKTNAQTIAGIKTFSVFPQVTATNPTLNNELIRKDYCDNNFMFKTGSVAESINGAKTFSGNATFSTQIICNNIYTRNLFSSLTSTTNSIYNDLIAGGAIVMGSSLGVNTIRGNTTFPNDITCNGTLNGSIIKCGNYQSVNSSSSVIIGGTTLAGSILIGTALGTAGTITIGSGVSAGNTINGPTLFNTLPTCTTNATANNQLVNWQTLNGQGFITSSSILSNANVWTNTNSFNSFLPTSTITATTANQLVNFTTLTTQGFTTLSLVQSNNNAFTGLCTFNTSLPTSTISASTANQFVNFTTLNGQSFVKPSFNNAWSGSNSFNTLIPTTTINATANDQIVNWQTLTGQSFVKPSFNNAWSGTNSFNSFLPTTTITATSANELVNFTTLNAQTFVKPSFNNAWSGSNSFNTSIPTTTINATANDQIVNWQTLNGQSFTTLAIVQSNANTFSAASNTFSNVINANGQINLKQNLLIYDLVGLTNYHRLYQSGNIFSIVPTGGTNTSYSFTTINSSSASVEALNFNSTNATFKGDITTSYNLNLYDTANPLKYTKLSMFSNNFEVSTLKTGGSLVDTTMTFNISLAGGSSQEMLKIQSNLITAGGNLYFNNPATCIIDSINTTGVTLFNSITSGAISLFESLTSNSVVKMFSDVASNVNLYINARVRFRNTKFYNQVKITTGGTLSFPLEENILINTSSNATITLPLINSTTQLGMTFNFIKNSTTAQITFNRQGTNTIMINNSISGVSSAILLDNGQTTTQLTCLEVVSGSGVYNWVVITSSLPTPIPNQIPVGSIIQMAVGTVPSGYLECNGQSVSTTTYAALSAVLNFVYGGSAPSGLFQVPDFRGIFLRGKGTSGINSDYFSSSSYGTIQNDGIKNHTHDIKFGYNQAYQGTGGAYNAYSSTTPNYNNPGGNAGNLGAGRATGITENNNLSYAETRPGNFPVLFCIKF